MEGYLRQRSNNVLLRITKKLLLFFVLIVLPLLLFTYSFTIKQVEIVGAEHYNEDQIKAFVFNTKLDSNSLYLFLKYNFIERPKFPFIERIDVKLIKPDHIRLSVYEKMVAGCVEMMGEYFYFDKDGIIVESSANKLDNVPLIKGLKFNQIILHEKLSIQKDMYIPYDKLESQASEKDGKAAAASAKGNDSRVMNDYVFNTIIKLTQLIDKYNIDVDTVSFNSNYEITLECGNITVLLGKRDTYDEVLSELGGIMKEVEGMDLTIDMKNKLKDSGGIIAKPK